MKLYAESPGMRSRQLIRDGIVVGWILLWVSLGALVYGVIVTVAEPVAAIGRGSDRLADSFDDVGDRINSVPVVGDSLEGPFRSAAGASRDLEAEAGRQRDAIRRAAFWISFLAALAPISVILLPYLAFRVRWIREATAAASLRVDADDLYVFALRALTNRPLRELRKVVPDPGAAVAGGDYEALAGLELRRLGLRT